MTRFELGVWDTDSPKTLLCTTDTWDKARWIREVFERYDSLLQLEIVEV